MRNFIIFSLGLLLTVSSFHSKAQESEKEKIKLMEMQREAEKQRQVSMLIDSAIYLSEHEMYEEADEKFLYALKNSKSIPSDLTYHFGRNSFYLGKYKQSVDWLNKYIQLKGTTGQYSEASAEWLKKAETELLKEQKVQSKQAAEILSKDYDIDCGPAGKVVCPVCNGATVIIKKGYFGETYKTCPYCSKHGFLSCEDYNKLVRGQLSPSNN